jgi:tRNA U38,U39,U40 pseudouridine synthase TruA
MTSLKFVDGTIFIKNKIRNAVFLIKTITYEEEKVEQLEAVLRHHRSAVYNHPYLFNGHLIWNEKKRNINFSE